MVKGNVNPFKKRCGKCKRIFLLSEFPLDSSKVDGRHALCKECRKKSRDKYRSSSKGVANEDRNNERNKKRREHDDKYADRRRAIVRKSMARPEERVRQLEANHSEHGKLKKRAHKALETAIKSGRILRPTKCQQCGKDPGYDVRGRSKIRAYHYLGYAVEHRLDVKFLCPTCLNRLTAVPRR